MDKNNKHWSDDYLTISYIDGGRDPDIGLDCWGLCRDILHRHFDKPLLKGFGNIHANDKANMTTAYRQVKKDFLPCSPKDGAIAAGFNGSALIHVGVVIEASGLHVIHTSSRLGMSKCSVRHFNRLFSKVIYYDYKK